MGWFPGKLQFVLLASVVRRVNNAPVDSARHLVNIYPTDSAIRSLNNLDLMTTCRLVLNE